MRLLTHSAIASASAIESGIVPSANQITLFQSACQKTGSSTIAAVVVEADEARRPAPFGVEKKLCQTSRAPASA